MLSASLNIYFLPVVEQCDHNDTNVLIAPAMCVHCVCVCMGGGGGGGGVILKSYPNLIKLLKQNR